MGRAGGVGTPGVGGGFDGNPGKSGGSSGNRDGGTYKGRKGRPKIKRSRKRGPFSRTSSRGPNVRYYGGGGAVAAKPKPATKPATKPAAKSRGTAATKPKLAAKKIPAAVRGYKKGGAVRKPKKK